VSISFFLSSILTLLGQPYSFQLQCLSPAVPQYISPDAFLLGIHLSSFSLSLHKHTARSPISPLIFQTHNLKPSPSPSSLSPTPLGFGQAVGVRGFTWSLCLIRGIKPWLQSTHLEPDARSQYCSAERRQTLMEIGFWCQRAVSLPVCMALIKPLNLSEPQFPHLQSEDKDI
jgi:hypothetical protein